VGKAWGLKTTLPQTPHSTGSLRHWVRPFFRRHVRRPESSNGKLELAVHLKTADQSFCTFTSMINSVQECTYSKKHCRGLSLSIRSAGIRMALEHHRPDLGRLD